MIRLIRPVWSGYINPPEVLNEYHSIDRPSRIIGRFPTHGNVEQDLELLS